MLKTGRYRQKIGEYQENTDLLKQEAQKVPNRVKRLSMCLLGCFLAMYLVVIVIQIIVSLGGIMSL